jgi:hypothetical protein
MNFITSLAAFRGFAELRHRAANGSSPASDGRSPGQPAAREEPGEAFGREERSVTSG